jgi:hypothetical protein
MHYLQYLRQLRIIIGIVAIIAILGTLTYFLPGAAPWVPTGRLVVAVRAVPYTDTDLTLGLGIDNMALSAIDDRTQVSVLTRRVQFDPKSEATTILLDTSVRAREYTGFSFLLSSPELRNPTQGDTAPESVSLVHDNVAFPIPYTVVAGETTVILLSFETIQAMHESDKGKQYLPVVQGETRHGGSVGTSESGVTRIENGTISGSATYGMDWDGRMRLNFRASAVQTQATTTPIVPVVPAIPAANVSTSSASSTDTGSAQTSSTTPEKSK